MLCIGQVFPSDAPPPLMDHCVAPGYRALVAESTEGHCTQSLWSILSTCIYFDLK